MLFFLTFISSICWSQNINQFDINGQRHGTWKKNFDGTKHLRYEGQFNHGREIGVFNFYKLIKKRSVLSAEKVFSNDNDTVQVKFFTSRGKTISEGKMIDKIYIGSWTYYHKNSDKIMTKENYDNHGALQGERLVFYDNGVLAEKTNYNRGKKEGLSEIYSLNGVVLKRYHYENNELHGVFKAYNGKGEMVSDGVFKRGKKTGVWKFYKSNKLINQKDYTYKPKYKK